MLGIRTVRASYADESEDGLLAARGAVEEQLRADVVGLLVQGMNLAWGGQNTGRRGENGGGGNLYHVCCLVRCTV